MMGFQYESPFQGVHFQVSCWFFVCVFVSAVPCLVVDTGLKNHGWFTLSCDKIGVCNNHLLAQQAFFHALFRGEGGFLSDPPMGCGASIDGSGRTLRNGKTSRDDEGDEDEGDVKNNSGESNHSLDAQLNSKVPMNGSIPGRWGRWNCMFHCNNKVTTWKGLEKISACPWFLLKVVFFCFGDPKICFYWFWFLRDV